MRLTFVADYQTDGDFTFRNFDDILDVNSSLYNGADINLTTQMEDEHIYIALHATGKSLPCKWACRDLLEYLMCSINTNKHYMVKQVYDSLNFFYCRLFDSAVEKNEKYTMTGNASGNLMLHTDENDADQSQTIKPYWCTMKVEGRFVARIDAHNEQEALALMASEYQAADFGDLEDIDGETIIIEDEYGNYVWEK